jgi:hypothetical protein
MNLFMHVLLEQRLLLVSLLSGPDVTFHWFWKNLCFLGISNQIQHYKVLSMDDKNISVHVPADLKAKALDVLKVIISCFLHFPFCMDQMGMYFRKS